MSVPRPVFSENEMIENGISFSLPFCVNHFLSTLKCISQSRGISVIKFEHAIKFEEDVSGNPREMNRNAAEKNNKTHDFSFMARATKGEIRRSQ